MASGARLAHPLPGPYVPIMTVGTSTERAANWTKAPEGGQWVALFDGHCRFCTGQARQLGRFVGPTRLQLVSFQDEGILAQFPGLSHDACMKRLHVIRPDGRVYAGAEGVARAVALAPVVGRLAFGYYVPGIRQLAELAYARVARYRYEIAGRDCDGGTCSLHR